MTTLLLLTVAFAAIISSGSAADVCGGLIARVDPPPGAIVVDATGKYMNSYTTMVQGIAKLDLATLKEQTVFVFPGSYDEKVVIPMLRGPLVLQGYTCDTRSYNGNKATITHALAQSNLPADVTRSRNMQTSTIQFKSKNVRVYNLNFANTAGNVGQAVAAYVGGTNHGFYGCKFTGYQDTLLTQEGRQLYVNSLISGAVDFVFGPRAVAWFENCDIDVIGSGSITASGRASKDDPSIYVFNNAHVSSNKGSITTDLGRPWRPFARVVWQNSELSAVIKPTGWSAWNGDTNTKNVDYAEYKNTGPGAASDKRVAFSHQLTQAVKIETVLGSGYAKEWWVDAAYLQQK